MGRTAFGVIVLCYALGLALGNSSLVPGGILPLQQAFSDPEHVPCLFVSCLTGSVQPAGVEPGFIA